jgi:hypothetical protein
MGTPVQGVELVDYRNRYESLQSKQWKMKGKWFHFPVDRTQFEWLLTLFMTVHRDFDLKRVARQTQDALSPSKGESCVSRKM